MLNNKKQRRFAMDEDKNKITNKVIALICILRQSRKKLRMFWFNALIDIIKLCNSYTLYGLWLLMHEGKKSELGHLINVVLKQQ